MSYVKRPCHHQKAYSGETLPLVERWYWVCTDPGCLETGSDKMREPPTVDTGAYWRAMRQLMPDCWVPASVRKALGI